MADPSAVIERHTEDTAIVEYHQTSHDRPRRRGPMPLPQAISLAGWLNGAEWLTADQLAEVPATWTEYQAARSC